MAKQPTSYIFQVHHSVILLAITCGVAVLFGVLLCFYPGPEFLGSTFWPLIALPAALALGTGYKLIVRKPILQIDSKGITFFRSKIVVTWAQLQSAHVTAVAKGDDDTDDYLQVKYINAERTAIVETDFLISGSMDKSPAQVMAAIQFFQK